MATCWSSVGAWNRKDVPREKKVSSENSVSLLHIKYI